MSYIPLLHPCDRMDRQTARIIELEDKIAVYESRDNDQDGRIRNCMIVMIGGLFFFFGISKMFSLDGTQGLLCAGIFLICGGILCLEFCLHRVRNVAIKEPTEVNIYDSIYYLD
ncbi:hypothetical protein PtrSN002B_010320 [Pyrenophora tritici-repentis]|nr:hypothetical protein A1F99_080360 [Pyrenophora tritici-repentis]KAI0577954.1 hypothetical protein Alg215_06637 [Pyrenophora tritici-repentis]KAI0617662.1 hypothetical protein TUN199_10341 [Pyrenophora tritici-repentis]KAI1533598.1 hypothetical protein PtrSN002B_010320 [Pyrenophora tritici-repentis]KAI1559658.1 hypothetical protein PtrEW4_011626 [Pyrenophora tritici-repentis]